MNRIEKVIGNTTIWAGKTLKYTLLVMLICLLLWFVWGIIFKEVRENRLIKEGNEIVVKIELFRQEYDRLPVSLEEMGLKEKEGADALYYDVRSSFEYTVSFMISMDYNKYYYSDTKLWEDGYREMNNVSIRHNHQRLRTGENTHN